MYRVIGITNRHLCSREYFGQIERITGLPLEAVIVREKDMAEPEYKVLAQRVMEICEKNNTKCILHSFYGVADELGCRYIHLPFGVFKSAADIAERFDEAGTSVHSVSEAVEAERMGASYITAGHIFATDCKKGLEPRGLGFLKEVCESVSIPVYAIGGINRENMQSTIECGAAGVCIMSGLMKY